jgi:hypothetical protein
MGQNCKRVLPSSSRKERTLLWRVAAGIDSQKSAAREERLLDQAGPLRNRTSVGRVSLMKESL